MTNRKKEKEPEKKQLFVIKKGPRGRRKQKRLGAVVVKS